MKQNTKQPDYMILINKENKLPDDFEDAIEIISVENALGKKLQLEKKTYEAFLRLREDLLQNDGIQAELSSTYRTLTQQEEIFERYRNKFGIDYANKYVAKSGHSEHHTGLAIDVGIFLDGKFYNNIEDMMGIEHLFQIIHKKLPQYGFILRYPDGKKSVTDIGYEPWHFRYIDSPEIAREITNNELCFEEYLNADTF